MCNVRFNTHALSVSQRCRIRSLLEVSNSISLFCSGLYSTACNQNHQSSKINDHFRIIGIRKVEDLTIFDRYHQNYCFSEISKVMAPTFHLPNVLAIVHLLPVDM